VRRFNKNLKIGNGTEQFIYICVSIFNELSWVFDIILGVLLAIALFKGIKNIFCRISVTGFITWNLCT
jgi:hypothetical protein